MNSMSSIDFALWTIFIVAVTFLGAAFYLLPTIVAVSRGIRNVDLLSVIIALNVVLGWSVIGWIVAMVLAAPEPNPKDFALASSRAAFR